MKKQIVLATLATLATTSVYATKARMRALGQDAERGSFYLNDTRTIFRNAAHINKTNNYIVTEWGTAASTDDSATDPAAEGGFFRQAGSFNYGLYLGADLDAQNSKRFTDATTAATGYANTTVIAANTDNFLKRDNELDLFFGGDAGVEWGARLSYSSNDSEPTGGVKKEQSGLGLGLGIVMGDLDVYANIILSDESKGASTAGDKWEGEGMDLGLSYNLGGYNLFANYNTDGFKYTNEGSAAIESTRTTITLGAGHVKEVSSTSRLIMDVKYEMEKNEDKSTTTTEKNYTNLPVTVGFETDATSWLTLRGSISQSVIINEVEDKTSTATTKATDPNTTNVEAGMTLNFGKLMIDGVIGNTGQSGAATADTDSGVLSLDRLATRVAVSYWF